MDIEQVDPALRTATQRLPVPDLSRPLTRTALRIATRLMPVPRTDSVAVRTVRDAVEEMPPGLWIRRGAPPPMFSMHRHDDVEINLVLDGQLHYLFGGQPLTIREGEIAVFWAAQPHGLVDSRTGDMTRPATPA